MMPFNDPVEMKKAMELKLKFETTHYKETSFGGKYVGKAPVLIKKSSTMDFKMGKAKSQI